MPDTSGGTLNFNSTNGDAVVYSVLTSGPNRGRALWGRHIKSAQNIQHRVFDVEFSPADSGIAVVGQCWNSDLYLRYNELGATTDVSFTGGRTSGYVAKYDHDGGLDWAHGLDADDDANILGVAIDPKGETYFAGLVQGQGGDQVRWGSNSYALNGGVDATFAFFGSIDTAGAITPAGGAFGSTPNTVRLTDVNADATGQVTFVGMNAGAFTLFGEGVSAILGDASVLVFSFNTCTATSISSQPADLNLQAGDNATFSVTAANVSGPLSYQWFKDGTALSDGGAISGATTATLTITGVAMADAGDYVCEVTNACGTIASDTAKLDLTTGRDAASSLPVQVFPNPAADVLNLQLSGSRTMVATVRLLDLKGRELHRTELAAGTTQYALSIAQLPAGLYLVDVRSAEGSFRTRIVKR
jgi:hypothetical protein